MTPLPTLARQTAETLLSEMRVADRYNSPELEEHYPTVILDALYRATEASEKRVKELEDALSGLLHNSWHSPECNQ